MTVCSLHTSSSGLCDTCAARHSKYSSSITNFDDEKTNDGDTAADDNLANVENLENAIGICNTGLLETSDEKLDSIVQLEEVGESSTDPCQGINHN